MDWQTLDTGDWNITNNEVALIDGAQETKQILREHLRTFLGEYFLDTSIGVPYFQTVMQKGVPQQIVEAIFREEILSCEGVLSITAFSLEIEPTTRKATLNFTVLTDNGSVTVTETV